MSAISNKVRSAVLSRLSNVSTGFNANLVTTCAEYSLTPFALDFSVTSTNFYKGRITDYDLFVEAGYDQAQMMSLFIPSWRNITTGMGSMKANVFSGSAIAEIRLYLSNNSALLIDDFETLPDACEEAMVNTMNTLAAQPSLGTNGLVYNGDITCNRAAVVSGGLGWVTGIAWQMAFNVTNST
jgi:hypothetical protein